MLIQDYAEDVHAKNMANQSKLQLSLLEMEQHNFLIYLSINLCNYVISKENTAVVCMTQKKNWFEQDAYHNLVKELPFDGDKFQECLRLTRES